MDTISLKINGLDEPLTIKWDEASGIREEKKKDHKDFQKALLKHVTWYFCSLIGLILHQGIYKQKIFGLKR